MVFPTTFLSQSRADINIHLQTSLRCIYMSYDRFIDERLLTSRDALNKLQIKMKVLEIDESARDFSQRFGRRALVQKVLLTIKYNDTEEVEERELDVEEIEKRMKKERLFSSSNRWLASSDIKNGYVVASRHLDLLADAIALDILSI
jgi:hypothetical protein